MSDSPLILFLHDQPRAINKVGAILQKKGLIVEGATTSTEPKSSAALVIVDVPSASDGMKVANSLKAMGWKKPIVVLAQKVEDGAAEGVHCSPPAKIVETVMNLLGERSDHGTVESIIAGKTSKLKELRARGVEPFPHRWEKKDPISAINTLGAALKPEEHSGKQVTTAGRVMQLRLMGKAAFFHLQDTSAKSQAYIRLDTAGEGVFNLLKNDIQIGDFVGVSGEVFKTKTGEASVHVKTLNILAKALRPLPEKWHGLKDVEARFRQRHLDLISSAEVRKIFESRSAIIDAVRQTFRERGYLEVETPILLQQAGGASATPFKTFHRALGTDLYLRIATELYLKRLIIGGFDRVYEIGRIFRNEGIDTRHNPEFSMLEAYCAYADYHTMAELLEAVIGNATKALGIDSIEYRGHKIDLKPPFRRLYMPELWMSHCGEDIHNILKGKGFNRPALVSLAKKLAIESTDDTPSAKIFERIFDDKLLPHLIQPAFVFDHPTAITPLAKCKPGDESLVERFEFFLGTDELANAYTELNDPLDQRERFEEQGRQRQGGDEEADVLDEDFVQAMECGMPPTGGIGIGIDRLAMILTGNPSIREVILFPTLKPEGLEK